jgi:hypothetical protein
MDSSHWNPQVLRLLTPPLPQLGMYFRHLPMSEKHTCRHFASETGLFTFTVFFGS